MGASSSPANYEQRPLAELLDEVAGRKPAPAAGSVIAATAALAAALTAKVARRSTEQLPDAGALADRADALRARVAPLITADAAAVSAMLAARRNGGSGPPPAEAARIPQQIAEVAAETAELAAALARSGNPNLHHDALAAVDLAAQAAAVAASLTSANEAGSAAEAAQAAAQRAVDIAARLDRTA